MKQRTHSALLLSTLLLVASIALLSCTSTSNVQRADLAASTMQTVESDITAVLAELGAVESSLNALTRPGQSDAREALDEYSKHVTNLEKRGKQLIKNTDVMNRRGLEYFEEWQKQADTYTNPEIRSISEQRRVELSNIYDEIPRANAGVEEALTGYMSNVRDIQTFLSNDLTPRGIEAISPLVAQFQTEGRNLQRALGRVQSSIDRAETALALAGTN